MIKYKNLYLIGTSHISEESVKEVEDVITNLQPNVAALELDRTRYIQMNSKQQRRLKLSNLRFLGFKAFILNIFGAWLERRLGKKVGTEPGSEMKKAIELAKKFNIEIVLIDQDIKLTLNKLIARLTRKEKFNFLKDLILGSEDYDFNIKKVPSNTQINKIINNLKIKYPSFYLTVIKERNEIMAKNLYKLMSINNDRKVVGIVGAGHERAIIGEIKSIEKI